METNERIEIKQTLFAQQAYWSGRNTFITTTTTNECCLIENWFDCIFRTYLLFHLVVWWNSYFLQTKHTIFITYNVTVYIIIAVVENVRLNCVRNRKTVFVKIRFSFLFDLRFLFIFQLDWLKILSSKFCLLIYFFRQRFTF